MPTTPNRKRRRLALLAVVPLTLAGSALVKYSVPQRNLLAFSTRRADTSGWQKLFRLAFVDDKPYRWQSDHELLFLSADCSPGDIGLSLADLNTGNKMALPNSLQLAFASPVGGFIRHSFEEEQGRFPVLSPDGKRYAAHTRIGYPKPDWRHYAVVCARDGSRMRQMPTDSPDNLQWLPDSSGFVTIRESGGRLHLQVSRPDRDGVTEVLNAAVPPRRQRASNRLVALTPAHAMTLETDYAQLTTLLMNSVVSQKTGGASPAVYTLVEYDLQAKQEKRRTPIILSPGLNLRQLDAAPHVAPQGDRIAWGYVMEETPPFLAWLHRHIAAVKAPTQRLYTLRISRPDGSDSREIARLILPARNVGGVSVPQPSPNSLSWTPDGKHLSYIYQNTLYTIPVE